jgi:uncharacterized protein (TIGR00369 family)
MMKKLLLYFQPLLTRWMIQYAVPFNRSLGIKVVRVGAGAGAVALRLPRRRRNLNVAGTVHGGAILAFAETVHGVAVLSEFSPKTHRMLTREATIEYVAPGRGDLHVSFCLTDLVRSELSAQLQAKGRADVALESAVLDGSGTVIAKLAASYVITRRGKNQ